MNVRLRPLIVSLVTASVISQYALAQSEKISIRTRPSPNQTVRMKMVQEVEIQMTMDGLPANLPAGLGTGPMTIASTNTMVMTQKVGAVDSQGNVEVEMKIDEIRSDSTMNGRALPASGPASELAGKTFTVLFDQRGAIISSKMPSAGGLSENAFKQMVESLYENVPKDLVGLGEAVTAPLNFAIPVPLPGAGPLNLQGETKYKLISIDKQGASRIATVDITFDGKLISAMEIPSPNSNIKMNLDFKMNGAGRTLNNLDRGIVNSSETTSTIDGAIQMAGQTGQQAPTISMKMKGTIKSSVTTEE